MTPLPPTQPPLPRPLAWVYWLVPIVFALYTGLQAIREDWNSFWALVVLFIPFAGFFYALQVHTKKPTDLLADPNKITKERELSAYAMCAAVIVLVVLLGVNPSHAFVISAFSSQPTLVAEAQATPTPTPETCLCQAASDDLTIQCLIQKESEAVKLGDQPGLDLIAQVFSPDAIIYQGDTNTTWYSPASYYGKELSDLTFSKAMHFPIEQRELSAGRAFYVSGSSGIFTDKKGKTGTYDNPSPSEHWILAKNQQGCWAVTYFAFNASHITPFP